MKNENKLRQYQIEGIEFLANRKFGLIGDEPGLGKTVQALAASAKVPGPKLIICPQQVKTQWAEQIDLWLGDTHAIINSSRDRIPEHPTYLIINYALIIKPEILKTLKKRRYAVIICDESHRLKNGRAKRTKAVLSKRGLKPTCERMWFLTGTPVVNRPLDLYVMLKSCVPSLLEPYDNFIKYAYRYCGAYQGAFGLDTRGASNLPELKARLASFMMRRTKREVLEELPERIIEKIDFEPSDRVLKAIKEEESRTVERAGVEDPEMFRLGEIIRIRMAVAEHKIPEAVEFVKARLEEHEKIVLFYHHTKVRNALMAELSKFDPISISGDDPNVRRHQKCQDFIRKKQHRVLVGQIQACGEGIDGLQHVCSCCVFVEPSWSPKDLDQCISRLERWGQKNAVLAYILTIKGTIESRMMDVIRWKTRTINAIVNEPKGETPMSKPQYLEERLEAMEQQLEDICKLVKAFVDGQTPKADQPDEKLKTKKTRKTAATPKPEPEPEPETTAEKPKRADRLAELRTLAAKMCELEPDGQGKKRAVSIIQTVGGKGKKSSDLDDDQVEEVIKLFEEAIDDAES